MDRNELLRSLRPFILGFIILGFIIAALIFITRYAFITIDLSGVSGEKKLTISTSDGKIYSSQSTEESSVRLLVKRDHLTITVQQNEKKSFTETEVGLFASTKVSIGLVKQKESTKTISDTEGCQLVFSGSNYSYDCIAPNGIYKHAYTDLGGYKEKIQQGLEPSSRYIPYKNGVIYNTIIDGQTSLTYFNIQSKTNSSLLLNTTETPLSFNAYFAPNNTQPWFTYVNADTNQAYVLNDGKLHNTINTLEGTESIPFAINSFSSTDNTLFHYYGLSGEATDSDEETKAAEKVKFGYLKVYSLSEKTEKIIKTPKEFKPESIHALSDTSFVSYTDLGGVKFYEVTGDSLQKGDIFNSVRTPSLVTEKGFYFVSKDNALYFFDFESRTAQLQYQETNVRVASINAFGGDIYFSGFTQDSGALEYHMGYKLNTEKDATYPRLESVLPYSRDEVPIRTMDYNGNTLYVTLLLTSFIFDRATNQPIIDQSEYVAAKNAFLTKFKQDGFNPADYDIKFTY